MPEGIAEYEPSVPAGLSALLGEADAQITDLNRLEPAQARQVEALARQLLRQESLASSRIEGLAMSHKRIGEAAYDPGLSSDGEAKAVLANIEAMHEAIEIGRSSDRIVRQTIESLHRTLMESTKPEIAGKVRDRQNWVGGNWHTPIGAEFIPPPFDEVGPLLDDLAKFMNRTDLPATLQAALTHAQFETIHPFADGNGRIGRCLIHVIYKRRAIADHQVPPVSLLIATDVDAYVKALTAYRRERENEWFGYFSHTAVLAARAGATFGDRLSDLQETWREKAQVRRRSTADKLIDILPAHPVIDVRSAAELAGTSDEAARLALNRLEERDVLVRANKRDWGRVWEANGLWNLLDRFEESLATAPGASQTSRPAPRTN